KRRKAEYLGRGKNETPEWVFLGPGQIIGEEGKQVGHKEGAPLDMKNFRNRVFLKACNKAQIRRRRHAAFIHVDTNDERRESSICEGSGHASIKLTVDVYGHWIPGSIPIVRPSTSSVRSRHSSLGLPLSPAIDRRVAPNAEK